MNMNMNRMSEHEWMYYTDLHGNRLLIHEWRENFAQVWRQSDAGNLYPHYFSREEEEEQDVNDLPCTTMDCVMAADPALFEAWQV